MEGASDLTIVLIGGQALNYWCQVYADRVQELREAAPFTSKDLDFCATKTEAPELARRVRGRVKIATLDDNTPNSAVILYTDKSGTERQIDFLAQVAGLPDTKKLREGAIELGVKAGRIGQTVLVINPVQCLICRAHNVVTLPRYYDTPHGRQQLSASIHCAREFIRDMTAKSPRDGLALVRQVYDLAKHAVGIRLWHDEPPVDVFSCVEPLPGFGADFCEARVSGEDSCARISTAS